MSVCGEDIKAVFAVTDRCAILHNGEVKHHLVDLGIAVASDADKLVLYVVEHFNDFFGGVVCRQIVTGPVIKYIAKK